MITIHYDPECRAVPDGQVAEYVNSLIAEHARSTHSVLRAVGVGSIVQEFRLRVARGEIPHTDLQFVFEGQTITINEYARLSDWPKGFADFEDQRIVEIIRTMSAKRRANSK